MFFVFSVLVVKNIKYFCDSKCQKSKYIRDRRRPLKDGEAGFKARHIILCGLDAGNTEKIKSLCLQIT